MENYLFIINPVSGKGRGKEFLPQIDNFLKNNKVPHKIILTEYPKHATEIVKSEQANYDIIISVGGDGTLNEIINGINPKLSTKFGELPLGSGNDFAHNLGISDDVDSSLKFIISKEKSFTSCDVWQLEYNSKDSEKIQKRFINNFGLGFDAQVAYINQHKKIGSGIISYLIAVIRALNDYRFVNYTLLFDDLKIEGDKLLLTFGNGVSSGGGFYLTPKAMVDDGLIDITTLECLGRFNLLTKLPLALLNKVEIIKEANFYTTECAEIQLKDKVYIHTDGEADYIDTKNISVRRLEEKLNFITRL